MVRKIVTYNVNGLRAAVKKGFFEWLREYKPDILCLQETKLQPAQVQKGLFGGIGYYSYWHSALKKGYSGVALLTGREPDRIEPGMGFESYDAEGRLIRADFGDITVICVYVPSGTSGGIRQKFKMRFLDDFSAYLEKLKKERKNIIVSGDINICHKPIDINHPERHQKSSGFLPEERSWFDAFIGKGFVDTFREFNRQPEQYSWWSYRAGARKKNLGWRIDYHIISHDLRKRLLDASILHHVEHSDHCPVMAAIDF